VSVTKRAKLNDLTAPAAEAKSFDQWFFSQPKKVQDKMREQGVLPYREMVPSKHVFAIDPNNRAWATTDTPVERTEVDAFISRDHVGVMLKGFIDALAYSDSFVFRRHVELVRWALSLPGCLSSRTIAKMYGRSHFWTRARAKEIQRLVNSDACGMFPHVNAKRDKFKMRKPPAQPTHDR
jgi:hypothetical protein